MTNYNIFKIDFLENNQYGTPTFHSVPINKRFNTREEYLDWRAKWKAAYKELSEQIRHAKRNRSETRMTDNIFLHFQWGYRAMQGKRIANMMLDNLNQAKEYSAHQRLKRIEAETNKVEAA